MDRRWWTKFILLMVSTVWAAIYIYPTVANIDPTKSKFFFRDKLTLGLDLQGGLYLVMGVDFNKVFKEVVDRQAINLKRQLEDKGFKITSSKILTKVDGPDRIGDDDARILIEFDIKDREGVHALVKDAFWNLRITDDKPGKFEFGLTSNYRKDVREKTIDQSIEVIRNRIDELGVSEPTIASQGQDRVVVELPGVKDVTRAKDIIGRTAKLEWKMVDHEGMSKVNLPTVIADIEKEKTLEYKEGEKFSAYVEKLNEYAKGKIPEGSEISFERKKMPDGTMERLPYLLKATAELTGDDLTDAQVTINQQDNVPEVAFSLSPKGAKDFENLTGANIGKQLAIILDKTVYSAPSIRSKIPGGNGVITLGAGNYDESMREARDLALVLRAGALPAQLELLEQRVVGPSLGQDSVKMGTFASLVGILAVFLFISIYYRGSGLIAVFSLIINVVFVLAILVGLEATLTLPGIAGIALTVGIGVDSNVVIFERIREELRAGKSIMGAVDSGFQKAWRTVLDSNLTNAAAAIILMNFGTGAIKGFAVTMLIGIITTLFSAVFVCRLIFDFYLKVLERRGAKQLSI